MRKIDCHTVHGCTDMAHSSNNTLLCAAGPQAPVTVAWLIRTDWDEHMKGCWTARLMRPRCEKQEEQKETAQKLKKLEYYGFYVHYLGEEPSGANKAT